VVHRLGTKPTAKLRLREVQHGQQRRLLLAFRISGDDALHQGQCVRGESGRIFWLIIHHYKLRDQLARYHIQTTHRQNRIRNITTLDHFRISLIVDEARSSEVQAEGSASTVADQVKAEFAVTTFHTVVYFSLRDIGFAHNDLKVIDQGFHIIIDFFLRGKV